MYSNNDANYAIVNRNLVDTSVDKGDVLAIQEHYEGFKSHIS